MGVGHLQIVSNVSFGSKRVVTIFQEYLRLKRIVSISQVAVGSDKQCEQSKDHCDQSIQAVAWIIRALYGPTF